MRSSVAGAVAAVLVAVHSVEGVVEVGVGVQEGDVHVHAAGPDVTPRGAPGRRGTGPRLPVDGPDVEAVTVGDDPDGSGTAQGAVRRKAISSSSAVPMRVSSSLVQAVMLAPSGLCGGSQVSWPGWWRPATGRRSTGWFGGRRRTPGWPAGHRRRRWPGRRRPGGWCLSTPLAVPARSAGTLLCQQQVGGSSPASSQHRRSEAIWV